MMAQNLAHHLCISMEGGPMQRSRAVLPEGIYWQAGCQHEPHGSQIVIARSVRYLALILFGKAGDNLRISLEQFLNGRFVSAPTRGDKPEVRGASLHEQTKNIFVSK